MEKVANSPLVDLPICDDRHFDQSMKALALLPRKGDDDIRAELRLAIYQRMIGHYPKVAVSFMVETALAELEWFPSPKQCLDILARWERRDEHTTAKQAAISAVRQERQARLEDLMRAIERGEVEQQGIDALSDFEKAVAEARGIIRRQADGSYCARLIKGLADV